MKTIGTACRVLAALCFLLASVGEDLHAQTQARAFFDDSVVHEIRLDLEPSDWASLQQHYLDNTYYRADFTWNGITQSIGIRSRGTGSRSPIKPNLTLNFSRYIRTQNFLGLDRVSLKANNQDASNLREWLVMKLIRRMGLPAPREAPARLYINGHYQGFYTIVELLDPVFLQRNFGENGGYLYSWEAAGIYNFNDLGSDPSAYAPFLELETSQDAPDLLNFVKLVQAINRPLSPTFSETDYIRELSQYINPKLFLTYTAIETVIDDADGIINGVFGMNNFYLYQFQDQTLYQIIAWDKDLSFGYAGRDIMDGIAHGANMNVLAQRLIAIPDYRTAYLGALAKAAALLGGPGGWADREIVRQHDLIREHAFNDPNKQCTQAGVMFSCGGQEFANGVQAIREFLAERAGNVSFQVMAAGYIPPGSDPQISSVSVAGSGGEQFVSPGALVTIHGTGMGEAAESSELPLKRIMANTFVAVEGIRAPLLATSPERIEIQVPWDIPVSLAGIVVSVNGAMSNTQDVEASAATPAIFGVLHADGWPVAPDYPLAPGETVAIYATGLGGISANLNSGVAGPIDPPAYTLLTPEVSLGGVAMTVTFSGLAPGFAGLYQVNAKAPESLTPGQDATITLSAGGKSTSWELALP